MSQVVHRAFGVYGIIAHQDQLVVIKKNDGPYINRFDLPGGSLENGELLNLAIGREIKEETGLTVTKLTQVGTTSFRYPWQFEKWSINQHICVFYHILSTQGTLLDKVQQFKGQDSFGAVLMPLSEINLQNSPPLVLKAKSFLLNHLQFDDKDEIFEKWDVLDKPVF